jgi:hypothetical protein
MIEGVASAGFGGKAAFFVLLLSLLSLLLKLSHRLLRELLLVKESKKSVRRR